MENPFDFSGTNHISTERLSKVLQRLWKFSENIFLQLEPPNTDIFLKIIVTMLHTNL